jgi:hypothetical protein
MSINSCANAPGAMGTSTTAIDALKILTRFSFVITTALWRQSACQPIDLRPGQQESSGAEHIA